MGAGAAMQLGTGQWRLTVRRTGTALLECLCVCQTTTHLHGHAMPLTSILQGPGHSKVQFCMAALLATLVLDEEAMEIIQQRGEGHLVFEATLKLVSCLGTGPACLAT